MRRCAGAETGQAMANYLELLFYLAGFHAFADFALQTDWLYRAKNHKLPEGAEKADFGLPMWPLILGSHALIHGAGAAYLTGSVLIGVLETFAHAVIDYLKSDGKIGIYADQALHIACKAVWAAPLILA